MSTGIEDIGKKVEAASGDRGQRQVVLYLMVEAKDRFRI